MPHIPPSSSLEEAISTTGSRIPKQPLVLPVRDEASEAEESGWAAVGESKLQQMAMG